MYSKEASILKTAILNEQEGYEFYRLAAEKALDPEVRDVFNFLAEEEEKHAGWLTSAYKDVVENKIPSVEAESLKDVHSPGIFSLEKLKNAGSMVTTALHVGVMMEKASIDYYRAAAGKTEIEALKKLFLSLVDWEIIHLDELERAYDFAKEEWWASQGFSPA